MAGASPRGGLRRSLSVWQAIGLSIALMAPSMAANINPQASAATAGRAVPLTFLIAAVGVLLVSYTFVRLCQYYHHSGSVYAFVGATLGPRAGVVAGWGLLGTYTFYAVVTSTAAGIFGTAFLSAVGAWPHPPSWAPFLLAGVALALTLVVAIFPARRGTNVLLTVEGATVALILVVTVIVLVRLLAGNAPGGHQFTLSVFAPAPGTSFSPLFLAVVFGFLSFAGFEAASTLGEETTHPTRDIPRAILGTAVFGGIYFVVVTAIEMMGFGTNKAGVTAFSSSPSLLGDLGSSYVAAWLGDVITLGTTISAFGCCLASTVGASRLMYALARDAGGDRGLGRAGRTGCPRPGHAGHRGLRGGDLRHLPGCVRGHRGGKLRLVRHDRHADPAGGVRAGHDRVHHPGLRPAQAAGADVADHRPAGGPGGARVHAVPQRDPLSTLRAGPLVPGGSGDLAGGRAGRGVRGARLFASGWERR